MTRKFSIHCIIVASLTVAACGEEDEDPGAETFGTDGAVGDGSVSDAGTGGSCDGLTYESFAKPLFAQKCTLCHGAIPAGSSVRLDTVENVRTHKDDIISSAIEPRQMPKMPLTGDALPVADQAKLKKWLECGAP